MTAVIPATASAEILRRRAMRSSLVSFAENIQIPGAPLEDDSDEPIVLHEGTPFEYTTTLRELDEYSSDVETYHRKRAALAVHSEYGALFRPVGSSLALHHRILLEKIQTCMETRYGRLMVFMPPGSAKSTYCTVVAPLWRMGVVPGLQIILASYATPIAKKLGSKGRFIAEQAAYSGAFRVPKTLERVKLSPTTQAKEMWALTNGSEYMSGGLLSGLTGNRAGGVVIDDPVKGRKAAESKVERQATLDAFEDDLVTRMVPGAWMILIQTRWAFEDLAGSILPEDYAGQSGPVLCRDGMIWEVLNIPGKAEHEDDPLGRKKGEYLWTEWFDENFWQMYEPRPNDPDGPSERRWASLIQQRPRPDKGNFFEEDWFKRYELGKHPKTLNLYTFSDYATLDGSGDFTEHAVGGLDMDRDLWIVDWFYGQVETDVGINELLKLAREWGVTHGYGEEGIIRRAIQPAFRDAIREHNRKNPKGPRLRLHIEYLSSAGRKTTKALSFQSLAKSGRVWIPHCPWGDRLVESLGRYHAGVAHDDYLDVCGLMGRALETLRWERAKISRPRDPGPRPFSWEWLTYNEREAKKEPRVF